MKKLVDRVYSNQFNHPSVETALSTQAIPMTTSILATIHLVALEIRFLTLGTYLKAQLRVTTKVELVR